MAREAVALRPAPGADGGMPDPRSRAGMPDPYHYAHLLRAAKRADPGDDVMSLLMRACADDGGEVSLEEFENLFWLFAVAGNEKVRNGIPGGMVARLADPQPQRALRADPSLIASTVEEMLRWWTPVMTFRRTATTEVSIAGQRIRAGEKVVVSFNSANRDESVFPDPDRFEIRRYAAGSPARPHLAFGHGPDSCLGADLARVQMGDPAGGSSRADGVAGAGW
mgnify:CR=1 FL=1